MKTLDPKKSEELFYELRKLELMVMHLGGYVQNPDYVIENNAKENYDKFSLHCDNVINQLENIRDDVFNMHDSVCNLLD